jgi:Domain of unknown function (DUF4440)
VTDRPAEGRAGDAETLASLNDQFIEAFRRGAWDVLAPILSTTFRYLDGSTGEEWTMARYIADLDGRPMPSLNFDQLGVFVDGDVALVSARTSTAIGRYSRYIDTYRRTPEGWRCIHACVWPLGGDQDRGSADTGS